MPESSHGAPLATPTTFGSRRSYCTNARKPRARLLSSLCGSLPLRYRPGTSLRRSGTQPMAGTWLLQPSAQPPSCSTQVIATKHQGIFPKDFASIRALPGGELTLRDRYFGYIYSTYHQQVLQEKRGRNDIWRGLYQFPLFESDSLQTPEAVAHWVEDELSYSGGGRLAPTTFSLEHRLSHQILHITIYTAELESDAVGSTKYQWVNRSELGDYALPTPLVRFLEQLHWRSLSAPRTHPLGEVPFTPGFPPIHPPSVAMHAFGAFSLSLTMV